METKANFVLIGAFTLLAVLAGLGFFVWLAKVQINKTYTQYDILFDQVSGLDQSSSVTFNGVNVGKVLTIALDRTNGSLVRVRVEVAASTPVRVGTEATVASQGVTGVAYVGLEGGEPRAKFLTPDPLTGVAEIPSKPTVVQGLLADAPDLLAQAISVLDDMGRFTTPQNADHVTQILTNLNNASTKLGAIMDELTKASASFSGAADKISAFATRLDEVATNADATLTQAHSALTQARVVIGHIDNFAAEGLPQITRLSAQASRLVGDLSALTAKIQRDPTRFLLGNRTPDYPR
jgi:phospholipid/cholesterol/gamma-HCH transport system substrate-binding protein